MESVIRPICLFYPLLLALQGPLLSFIVASAVTYITWIQWQWRCQTWADARLSVLFQAQRYLQLHSVIPKPGSFTCFISYPVIPGMEGKWTGTWLESPGGPSLGIFCLLALLPKMQYIVRKENISIFSDGPFMYLKLHFWGRPFSQIACCIWWCILCHELIFGTCRILN